MLEEKPNNPGWKENRECKIYSIKALIPNNLFNKLCKIKIQRKGRRNSIMVH